MSGSCTRTLKKCSLWCSHLASPPLPALWSSPRRGWAWPGTIQSTPPTPLRCSTWQTKVKKKYIATLDWYSSSIFLSLSLPPASYTGQAEDSHTDTITALDASPKLKLFASCSKDCTVRIWTEDNHPVRCVHVIAVVAMGQGFSIQYNLFFSTMSLVSRVYYKILLICKCSNDYINDCVRVCVLQSSTVGLCSRRPRVLLSAGGHHDRPAHPPTHHQQHHMWEKTGPSASFKDLFAP